MGKIAAIALAGITALTIADLWAHGSVTKSVLGFGTNTVNRISGH